MAYQHRVHQHELDQPNIVVPYILQLIKPNSVLDIGCGFGHWLKVFKNNGTPEVLGVDGEYVLQEHRLKFLEDGEFMSYDLTKELDLKRKFDLVLSLEVAEHIPEKSADIFVKTLVNHGDLVVFSAAIPFQGGQNHINEKPLSYWVSKFKAYGYYFYDPFRQKIWDEKELFFWYKQNMVLFSKHALDLPQPSLPFEIAHPDLVREKDKFFVAYQDLMLGNAGVAKSFKVFVKSLFKVIT